MANSIEQWKNGLGIVASANAMYNGLNEDANDYLDNREIQYNMGISRPRYFNIPLLVGANYAFPLSPEASFFIEAQGGVNFRIITDMTLEQGTSESTDCPQAWLYALRKKTSMLKQPVKAAFFLFLRRKIPLFSAKMRRIIRIFAA